MSLILHPLENRRQAIPLPSLDKYLSFMNVTLQLLIIGTRKLQGFGLNTLKSPFVRVSSGNNVACETKVGEKGEDLKSNNHNFLEILEMKLNVMKYPDFAPCLIFKVLDKGYGAEHFLGATSINLGKYLP